MSRLAVLLPATPDGAPLWLRIADGAVVAGGEARDPAWEQPTEGSVLIAPAGATTIHRATLPDLAPRQAQAAARLMALENSIGGEATHAAAGPREADGGLDIAVVAAADMRAWLAWAAAQGIDPEAVVPASLLLPRPGEGFVRGRIGEETVLRGPTSGFVDGAAAALVVGDAPVAELDAARVEEAVARALASPPLNLRQGAFARRRRRGIDWALVRRCAILIGGIFLASLLIAVIELVKVERDVARLDAATIERARAVAPGVSSAAQAEAAVNDRLAARGLGGRGLGGQLARLFAALQGAPTVSLAAIDAPGGGTLRVTLAAPTAAEAQGVASALLASGYAVASDPPQVSAGQATLVVTVRAP